MALPENLTGEILNGELYTQPRPSGRNAAAVLGLGITVCSTKGKHHAH